ncbi:MAG: tetraacyldisaccharide 4'-kinase, partial [Pseudomonadota bacterium]
MSEAHQIILDKIWYRNTLHPIAIALLPVSWLFRAMVYTRYQLYRRGWFKSIKTPVPVIVVGNISVGGAGKTPLVIWLAKLLKHHGFSPGIVSRGYGGATTEMPRIVKADSNPAETGDEPVLIAQHTNCPVVVFRKRPLAINTLLTQFECDVVLSDDGMQHYPMARDIEIAVIDSQRGLGNQQCLPAGPLREPPARLQQVDFIVSKEGKTEGFTMQYVPGELTNLKNASNRKPLDEFQGKTVHAVAGIGNPQGFF